MILFKNQISHDSRAYTVFSLDKQVLTLDLLPRILTSVSPVLRNKGKKGRKYFKKLVRRRAYSPIPSCNHKSRLSRTMILFASTRRPRVGRCLAILSVLWGEETTEESNRGKMARSTMQRNNLAIGVFFLEKSPITHEGSINAYYTLYR